MGHRARFPRGALLSLLLSLLVVVGAGAAAGAGNASRVWRPPAGAERRGWVPLNMPCPTCRHSALGVVDSSPQGAAAVGRAVPPPPHFAQQQQQQPFLQPFQQQLLLSQPSFAPPPSAAAAGPDADANLYLLRPQASPPSAISGSGPSAPPSPPLQQQDLQQVSQRPPPAATLDPLQAPREEVQLLYVPVEALRPRNRGPTPNVQQRPQQLQPQLQSAQIPPHLLLQTQSPPPLLAPSPTPSTTTTTTTTSTTTTTLAPLQGRHRFRGSVPQDKSRYLEQPLPRPPPPSPAPDRSPTASSPASPPAPHQPPLSIFVSRHAASGTPRVSDVISALRGSRSIAVMDEPGPGAPQVFVGPANLSPPPGFSKFELPYLSAIMAQSRGERRVDSLPFFVAPLSFRPPPGYSKIPFPAPHVGSVVVANATAPAPPPHSTTPHSAVASVALPADLPPISAELPALVNSLQDSRQTGDVLLLPAGRDAAQGQRAPLQQQMEPPARQHTPLEYRPTPAGPAYAQQVPEYPTQPPVTDIYPPNTQLPVQNEHTTNLPQSLNAYQEQQHLIDQYQQDYLQPTRQQTLPPQQTRAQQHLSAQQQQHRQPLPVHEERYPVTEAEPAALGHAQEQALNAGLQTLHAGVILQQETGVPETTPALTTTTTTTSTSTTSPRRQHFRGRQRASSNLASASPSPSPSVTAGPEPSRRPPSRSRRPTHPSRTRGDDASAEAGAPRGQHRFRGRGPTRQTPSTDATTLPYNPPAETTPAHDPVGETTPAYQPIGFNPVAETTPAYQQPAFRPAAVTTPAYHQRPSYSTVERTPSYEAISYTTVERTPERKRPAYSSVERAPEHPRSAYTSVEGAAEHQRPTYTTPERAHEPQQPAYSSVETTPDYPQPPAYAPESDGSQQGYSLAAAFQPAEEANPNNQGAHAAGGESDTNLRSTPPYTQQQQAYPEASLPDSPVAPVDPTAAQYLDSGNYRQHGDVAAYGATSEQTPDTTVENSTPTAEDVSSTHPPMEPGTFQRTRGRKGQQVKYQASTGDLHGATPRPVQVRLRGRVRSSRPRPPPEPENYPANFHDAAVFDATRRPAADYSFQPAAPAAAAVTTTEAIAPPAPPAPPARNRGNFLARGSPRRPAAPSAIDLPTTPAPDKVYTVRPARRPQAAPQTRVTSVRGRIRRPTTTPRTTTEPATTTTTTTTSTTAAAAAEDHLPSAHAGGFQANEVLQQPSVAVPDYYDYLAAEPAQDSPSGAVVDFRRPFTASYEDDDPEAGGAESQWTGKWHQQHPNSLSTEPSTAKPSLGGDAPDSSAPVSSAPSAYDDLDLLDEATPPATPTPLEAAMALGAPDAAASARAAPDRKHRRLRVRVRTRVSPRDMLEPAESQNIATLANSIPAAAKKPWSASAPREVPPAVTEPLDAPSTPADLLYDTTTAPPTDSLAATTPLPAAPDAYYTTSEPATEALPPTTQAPLTESASYTPKPDVEESEHDVAFTGPGEDDADSLDATSQPVFNENSKPSEEDSESFEDLAAVSAREEAPAEELPASTTEDPTSTPTPTTTTTTTTTATATMTTTPTTTTTTAPTVPEQSSIAIANATTIPDPFTPAGRLYSDIQRARAAVTRDSPSQATARLLGTSTTTEVSHETEICYRGRCVKTKSRHETPTEEAGAGRGP
ncbi:hypothetical protein R5R35_002633 [Gryllus longicercus]|uniref:Uncharacterized protein n=1 Tax=Gryllus longicercus TaxID=2509291 RepID=A0AAN9YX20_9ORTH